MPPAKASANTVSFAEAMRIVSAHAAEIVPSGSAESVDLLGARGRVLATPIVADRDQPPFDRSTRDGFAARASDLAARRQLRLAGSIRAGDKSHDIDIGAGEAFEIMTGAPVPGGADCVAMVEHTEAEGCSIRLIDSAKRPHPGDNIVRRGSEARAGDQLVPRGARIGAPEIAIAAACGCVAVEVFRRASAAILPTGDELVEVADLPLAHQIRNSNSCALAAQVADAGGQPVRLRIARDDLAALLGAIESARGCDLLLLSGGVSMGKYDLVEQALASLGAEFFFTGVAMQPGKPVVFGRLPATSARPPQYFFGLPGNPISTQVTFQLFARPLLLAVCGAADRSAPFVQAKLASDVKAKPGLTRFLPARVEHGLHGATVAPIAWQGSGDQAAQARANCYLVVPDDCKGLAAGATATILLR